MHLNQLYCHLYTLVKRLYYVVVGDKPGSKLNEAIVLDLKIIKEQNFKKLVIGKIN